MTALELARAGVETTIFAAESESVEEIERDLGESIGSISIVTLPQTRRSAKFRAVGQAAADLVEARAIRRRDLDLFVNCDYGSTLPACGRVSVFYCHFPHVEVVRPESFGQRAYLWAVSCARRVVVDQGHPTPIASYDLVWANSVYTARHVEQMWGKSAHVIYPPCDQLPSSPKQRTITVVGRFQSGEGPSTPHKSQKYLADTFSRLTDLHEEGWRIIFLGSASSEDEIFVDELREILAGLPADVHVNPSRSELADAVAASTIFWHAQGVGKDAKTYPQSQEHFGISTVEAMSAGAIPLVYGEAGPAEIVAPVEGIEPWLNQEGLLAATRSVARQSDTERAATAQACTTRARDFDRDHYAQQLKEALEGFGGAPDTSTTMRRRAADGGTHGAWAVSEEQSDRSCAVSVVIPAHNAAATISAQLEALAKQEGARDFEVIVVDNGSSDDTSSVVAALIANSPYRLRVRHADEKRGPGYARNCGAEAAAGETLLFCDADDVVTPSWARELAEDASRSGAAAGYLTKFSSTLMAVGTSQTSDTARQLWKQNPQLPWPVSACLGVRRDVFRAVGGFDETLASGEDIDFGMKLVGHRIPLAQSSAAVGYRMRGTQAAERAQLRAYAYADTLMQLRHARLLEENGLRPDGIWGDVRSLVGHIRRYAPITREYGRYAWGTWSVTRIARIQAHFTHFFTRGVGRR